MKIICIWTFAHHHRNTRGIHLYTYRHAHMGMHVFYYVTKQASACKKERVGGIILLKMTMETLVFVKLQPNFGPSPSDSVI